MGGERLMVTEGDRGTLRDTEEPKGREHTVWREEQWQG